MGLKNCMNKVCRATTSSEWKKGWSLKSGGFATFCCDCGSAYENSIFCELFHSEESGWRECGICGKRVHCGCIASRYLYEFMDFGGIACISCAKHLGIYSVQSIQIPGDIPNGKFFANRDVHPIAAENRTDAEKFSTERLLQLTKAIKVNNVASAPEQLIQKQSMPKIEESSKCLLNLSQQGSLCAFVKADDSRAKQGAKDMYESLAQPSQNLTTHLGSSSTLLPFCGGTVDRSDQSEGSFQPGQRTHNTFSKLPKLSPIAGLETYKGAVSHLRVARPPAEGRGHIQLLPRYWPRITDQELQQLSGDLKSTIVPLFEKILSASDAGRIGRLVLPKACAEAYFPAINQSEGIPIDIQDIKGNEWTFQFRFWPNNNSRMYVLEGVTPCIQNMQLQAGDTVIFSRRDPEGQLVIGCRKAKNNVDVQEPQMPVLPNGDPPVEASCSGVSENILSNGGRVSDDFVQQHMTVSNKKKARNIKNKTLLAHNDDAVKMRITWEEAQEFFHPSPSAKPTVVMVEDHEFEEFEEPPIFGKRTIFISRASGCSDPVDINPRDLDCFSINNDSKTSREGEPPSGLDALATAAVLGDDICDLGESSVGPTTKHPRHRPGCTCIVCIQPPSGKGKHEPTCKCNVCLTVRRRFTTLMMRKKKRQSERETKLTPGKDNTPAKADFEKEGIAGDVLPNMSHPENEKNHPGNQMDLEVINKGQLDLNCDPHHEINTMAEAVAATSLTALITAVGRPLDMHLGQNGIVNSTAGEKNVSDEGA